MNARVKNGLRVENNVLVRPSQQASGVHESLMRRLLALLDSTMRETWLPMGFRVLVVQEFPAMRHEVERESVESLSAKVAHLVAEAEPYKAFAGRSEALLALKLLDAEVKGHSLAA